MAYRVVDRPTNWGAAPLAAPKPAEFRQAADRLRGVVMRTPVARLAPDDIALKLELLQPTGSFKVRGVYNWALGLAPSERSRGFSTFSAGNTALALGHAARRLGVPCRSLVLDHAPAVKVEALRRAGVDTALVSFEQMMEWLFSTGWRREPWAFLHPWTEPALLAGHGTIGLELVEDLPDLERLFVPVGGGALAAGVASAVKNVRSSVQVIGVESEAYPALAAGFACGRPVWVEHGATVCDGTAVPFAPAPLFGLLRDVLDGVVVISERAVRAAIRLLHRRTGYAVEGAGALALAAALVLPSAGRRHTACVLSGGNIDPPLHADIVRGAD